MRIFQAPAKAMNRSINRQSIRHVTVHDPILRLTLRSKFAVLSVLVFFGTGLKLKYVLDFGPISPCLCGPRSASCEYGADQAMISTLYWPGIAPKTMEDDIGHMPENFGRPPYPRILGTRA
jgi:hypothetical protein